MMTEINNEGGVSIEAGGALPDRTRVAGEDPSDADLMARLASGDRAALGTLYERYSRMIYSVISRYGSSMGAEEAEDLCQEVFLGLTDAARSYREEGKLRAWLCRLAINRARSYSRTKWGRRALLATLGRSDSPGRSHQPSPTKRVEAQHDIAPALASLPKAQREVLLLHWVEELSGEEIAQALGIKVNAVWARLHRARESLRRYVAATEAEAAI